MSGDVLLSEPNGLLCLPAAGVGSPLCVVLLKDAREEPVA